MRIKYLRGKRTNIEKRKKTETLCIIDSNAVHMKI